MAIHDWNNNGDKNDMTDNFIEYQIFQDISKEEKKSTSYTEYTSNGISTGGAIVSVVMGLVLQSVIYVSMGIDVDDVPLLVIIVLWGIFSFFTAIVLEKLGL